MISIVSSRQDGAWLELIIKCRVKVKQPVRKPRRKRKMLAKDIILGRLKRTKVASLTSLNNLVQRHGFDDRIIYRVVQDLTYRGIVKVKGHRYNRSVALA